MDCDRSWSPQEWKSEVTAHDRSGKPDKTSWNAVQQVRPHHGDTLLDGDAQGNPDSANYQEEADSEIFVMGNDAQQNLRIKQKIKCEKDRKECRTLQILERAFNNLGNVHGCDDECGDIHGKEFHG